MGGRLNGLKGLRRTPKTKSEMRPVYLRTVAMLTRSVRSGNGSGPLGTSGDRPFGPSGHPGTTMLASGQGKDRLLSDHLETAGTARACPGFRGVSPSQPRVLRKRGAERSARLAGPIAELLVLSRPRAAGSHRSKGQLAASDRGASISPATGSRSLA